MMPSNLIDRVKYTMLVFLSLLCFGVNGQSDWTCDLRDYMSKDNNGHSIEYQILSDNTETLVKDFKNEKTFSLRVFCFVKAEFKDSTLTLQPDTILISGRNSVSTINWENDFKANFNSIVQKFKPYLLLDSLKNDNCERLFLHTTVRRCR